MMGLQLFFCSGHFCEFSGLQYASAFIGFDSMVWYSSGALLLLNTCGFLALAVLAMPLMLACCDAAGGGGACGGGSGDAAGTSCTQQGLLLVCSMRFAALVVAMISAAVQQQHILLWAIFAPKLVFELWFMAVTAAGQLLGARLLSVLCV
jgi:phosphatidylinositol glycan class O